MHMSPAFNGSSEIQRFECSDAIETHEGIMLAFYPKRPRMPITLLGYKLDFLKGFSSAIWRECLMPMHYSNCHPMAGTKGTKNIRQPNKLTR